MSPTLDAFLRSWPWDPWLIAALALSAGLYLRGWKALQSKGRWRSQHRAAFLGGLAAIYLALASPLEPFSGLLLQVHMLQHLLLTMVAPPLLWLAAPLLPLLRGLPRAVRVYWVIPLLSGPPLRRLFARCTHPLIALGIFVAATWLWHVPALYDLALRSDAWHYVQHVCFFGAGLLFWYPVVGPYPSRPSWSPWLLLPTLLLADLANTVLAALLTFSERVLYGHYADMPRLGGISALADQSASGVIMWVPGSLAFLGPLFVIGVKLLSAPRGANQVEPRRLAVDVQGPPPLHMRTPLPLVTAPAPVDVLRVPLLGRFLRWRQARVALQVPLLILAAAVVYDGLHGPEVSAMNLAGVLPWVHWRGLVVLGLLAAGNLFCLGCPFVLPRTMARRWLPARWHWPRRLRSKWVAVALLIVFFWAYEAFSLWDRPWWTAWLTLGYFMLVLIVDGLFRGASFCKYVCPIGQFNFVSALVSPLQVKVRQAAVCASCESRDCIRGRAGMRGCELDLFLPHKAGNLDCTTCLDCVRACPHDNVGLIAGAPGRDLWHDRPRSGIGRLARRPDIACLVLVFVFAAFANAAGMVAPVVAGHERLAAALRLQSTFLVTTAFYSLTLIALPLAIVASASALSRSWGRLDGSAAQVATRFSFALVPLGFGMWLAHYSFHLLTGYWAVLPAVQRFAADLGIGAFGEPTWSTACCAPSLPWLLELEIVFLDLGLLLSLYAAYRIARTQSAQYSQVLKAVVPWALVMVMLFALGVWILFQPMQMRGTLSGA